MRQRWQAFAFNALFVAQSDHGVHAHGAARRDVTCRNGHNNQQHGNADESQRVIRAYAEELRPDT